jgi:hypothetical protein
MTHMSEGQALSEAKLSGDQPCEMVPLILPIVNSTQLGRRLCN